MSIWVIDDDITLRKIVGEILRQEGFEVREFPGAEGVVESLDDPPSLILLDVHMPDRKGTDLCREIRVHSSVPIIFLSSASDTIDRVVGLEVGADDYIVKPFNHRELAARVHAVLRRSNPGDTNSAHDVLRVGKLSLDPVSIEVELDGRRLELTHTEFRLLQTLMEKPRKVFSRKELMAGAYDGVRVSTKTIDSHIRRVRTHFEWCRIDPVRTVRGVGYTLDVELLESVVTDRYR